MGFMGMGVVVFVVGASILLGCINNVKGECLNREKTIKKGMIYVRGEILCQDCNRDWVQGATPIKGCVVSITCIVDKNKGIIYRGRETSNEKGEFEMKLNKYMNGGKDLIKPELCKVKLVSSPDPDCYVPTDLGGGRLGVKLNTTSSTSHDMITKYNVGSFSFTTPLCDEPDS